MNKTPAVRFKGFTDDWEQRKLSELGEIATGSTPPTTKSEYYSDDGLPWVTPTDIESNIISDSPRKLSDEGAKVARVVPANTILCTCIASIGKNALLTVKGSFNQQINSLTPNGENDSYFLLTASEIWSNHMKQMAASGTMQIVNKTEFSETLAMITKYDEQKVIGEHFKYLDNLVALHKRKYEKLVNLKNSMLYKMFPQNGSKVPEIRFAGFAGDWEKRKLGEWGTFYYGRSCPKWSVTDNATIPCIRYGELYTKFGEKIDKVFSYTNMNPQNLRFSKGNEVLIPRVGEDPKDYNHCTWLSIKDVAIGEMISVFNTQQNPLFAATMFNATMQEEFAIRVEGGSVTNLYFDKLKDIDTFFPSLEEQRIIASFFEKINKTIILHQRKLEKLKQIKQAMLHKMFV